MPPIKVNLASTHQPHKLAFTTLSGVLSSRALKAISLECGAHSAMFTMLIVRTHSAPQLSTTCMCLQHPCQTSASQVPHQLQQLFHLSLQPCLGLAGLFAWLIVLLALLAGRQIPTPSPGGQWWRLLLLLLQVLLVWLFFAANSADLLPARQRDLLSNIQHWQAPRLRCDLLRACPTLLTNHIYYESGLQGCMLASRR